MSVSASDGPHEFVVAPSSPRSPNDSACPCTPTTASGSRSSTHPRRCAGWCVPRNARAAGADVGDRGLQAAETVYQALIGADLTETIGTGKPAECLSNRLGHSHLISGSIFDSRSPQVKREPVVGIEPTNLPLTRRRVDDLWRVYLHERCTPQWPRWLVCLRPPQTRTTCDSTPRASSSRLPAERGPPTERGGFRESVRQGATIDGRNGGRPRACPQLGSHEFLVAPKVAERLGVPLRAGDRVRFEITTSEGCVTPRRRRLIWLSSVSSGGRAEANQVTRKAHTATTPGSCELADGESGSVCCVRRRGGTERNRWARACR
jgi:hypothetical protein